MSQIDKYSEKYNLKPDMGLSYVQIGILKRLFVICDEVEDNIFENYVIIRWKLMCNKNKRRTYNCLST